MYPLGNKQTLAGAVARARRLFTERAVARRLNFPGPLRKWKRNADDGLCCSLLLAEAVLIGCFNLSGSGTLWPDGPQYANAAVMIHDLILSDDLLSPYQFAQSQYAQYPAFHLPFHPPAYPSLLALFFLATGVSYISARVFVALCLGISGCFFYAILRHMNAGRAVAVGCAFVLLTMPEVAQWSRDTMSEVPALALLLAGSYFFLRWLESKKFIHCLIAFGLAEAAFLSRVTTATAIPIWLLFIFLTGRQRKLPTLHVLLLTAVYLLVNAGWIVFVSRFSKYELGLGGSSASAAGDNLLSWQSASFYLFHLPKLAGWGTLVMAGLGLACALWLWGREVFGVYCVSWLIASCAFLFVLGPTPEQRYFFYVLPSFAGFAAVLFNRHLNKFIRTRVAPGLLCLCLATNLIYLKHLPKGVLGYEAVAQQLAQTTTPGNIMSVSWATQDFIFRYQAGRPNVQRRVIRGDRTLAVRLSTYGGVSGGVKMEPTILAHNRQEVLDILRRGRVRYLITCMPDDPRRDDRTHEMVLAHEVAQSSPESFALYGKFPLLLNYAGDLYTAEPLTAQVFVWQFLEELSPNPSELPVIIPTADLILN
jgi:hypothetical protein